MRSFAAFLFAGVLCFLVAVVAGGCGSRSTLDYGDGGLAESSLPSGCGDGVCSATESCTTCSVDCGVCSTCGNHICDPSETCTSCPQDCDVCPTCGDGYCNGDETCESCAPDCGTCQSCGDGTCQAPKEDCFTCPADCGTCMGCGDGTCTPPETCASCEADCGPCAVCGNGTCQPPYETCDNCPADCGACNVTDCLQTLECVIPCLGLNGGIGGGGGGGGSSSSSSGGGGGGGSGGFGGLGDAGLPPDALTCAAACIANACAGAGYFVDEAFGCFLENFSSCMPVSLACIEGKCNSQVDACLGYTCPM